MTGDEFTARYRLREQLNDGDIVSYRAADARGGTAFVHVFRGEFVPEFDASLLDAEGSEALREVLDVEGIAVIVTDVIEPFTTFEAWAAEHQRPPEEEGPGAFTRIFRVQAPDGPPAPPVETPPSPSTPPVQAASPVASDAPDDGVPEDGGVPDDAVEEPLEAEPHGPGAFTRAFGAVGTPPPSPPSSPSPPRPASPPPPPPPKESPEAARPDRPADRPAASAGTSGVAVPPDAPTREMPTARTPPPVPRPPATPPPAETPRPPEPPEPPAERGTGTFTRIMGAVREGRSPAAPPPRPGGAPPPRPDDPTSGGREPPRPEPARPASPPPEPPIPRAPLQPPPPPPVQGGAPGPYTLAMRAYKGPGQARPRSPASDEGGAVDSSSWDTTGSYLDRLQSKPGPADSTAPRPPGAVPPPLPPRPQGPVAPAGPSDYTRVIRGAAVPPGGRSGPEPPPTYGAPPPVSKPSPQQPRPAPAPSRMPIIIALIVTVVVLVAVILVFALRGG